MNLDDPKLTAYALDEVDEVERTAIARTTAASPELQRFVADTQKLAGLLRAGYGFELETEALAKKKVAAVHEEDFWSKAGPLAIAALLAVLAVVGALALSSKRSGIQRLSSSPDLAGARLEVRDLGSVEGENPTLAGQNQNAEANAGPYAYTGERPFVSVVSRPRSNVPLLVNLASYLDVRRSINNGILPAKDAVRIEGMINHFSYHYPQPLGKERFSLNADVVTCPWESSHRLVRIALKGREAIVVSENSGIEVEFNPKCVTSYRLIGYDRQASGTPDLNDANREWEHIPTEYNLTVLYEVVVPRSKRLTTTTMGDTDGSGQSAEYLLSVKLQLITPTHDTMPPIERVVRDSGSAFAVAPQDLKFAAAVAEFGMILRDSEYKGNGTLENVLQWAVEGKGSDREGHRADFIELVRKAQALSRG